MPHGMAPYTTGSVYPGQRQCVFVVAAVLCCQRLAARRHECANLLLADISLSGASQLSFAVALEKAEKTDPAATALRRCYRAFSRLSVLNERLGLRAGYTKGGAQ